MYPWSNWYKTVTNQKIIVLKQFDLRLKLLQFIVIRFKVVILNISNYVSYVMKKS